MANTSKIEKEANQFKSKGNRKQFEVNAQIANVLSDIRDNVDNSIKVRKLVEEGQQVIKKRQKLITIADRTKDGWSVVQEYESDDLASDSEDEKRLSKAKNAAEKKRKESKLKYTNSVEKCSSLTAIISFFVVKYLVNMYFVMFHVGWECLSNQPYTRLSVLICSI